MNDVIHYRENGRLFKAQVSMHRGKPIGIANSPFSVSDADALRLMAEGKQPATRRTVEVLKVDGSAFERLEEDAERDAILADRKARKARTATPEKVDG